MPALTLSNNCCAMSDLFGLWSDFWHGLLTGDGYNAVELAQHTKLKTLKMPVKSLTLPREAISFDSSFCRCWDFWSFIFNSDPFSPRATPTALPEIGVLYPSNIYVQETYYATWILCTQFWSIAYKGIILEQSNRSPPAWKEISGQIIARHRAMLCEERTGSLTKILSQIV